MSASLTRAEFDALVATADLSELTSRAAALRDVGFGRNHTYSPKVFIPLTHLCRDVCHYCTFAQAPKRGQPAFLSRHQVLEIARAGARVGCTEALFTLGDKPELRYGAARAALAELGHESTLGYLAEACALVLKETGLLPHVNAGVMQTADIAMLRGVSASQGLMLESISSRLCERGGPHFGSPDKLPSRRLETIRKAGELRVPFTSGILIGIGETRDERIDSLFALRELHLRHGHIQEIIIQNFRAKPATRMAGAAEPNLDDLVWTIAIARLIFGPRMSIQAPPNLSPGEYGQLIAAGVNDWGGVSPVTLDYVNPEAPWPHIEALRAETSCAGKILAARLPIYPTYLMNSDRWLDPRVVRPVSRLADADGLARMDLWAPGIKVAPTMPTRSWQPQVDRAIVGIVAKASAGHTLKEAEIVALFRARGSDFGFVCEAADALRARVVGDVVTYVVNRNINYTNICGYKCRFCAFSKGRSHQSLRGPAYDLDHEEVIRRAREAWARGATEVCMQGGIHPDYTGKTYLDLCRLVKQELPELHIHAFSPLEVQQGAATLGLPDRGFLELLKEAGLGTLPGTAAEILDEPVRRVLCPDKLDTQEWLEVVATAHEVGFRTTATVMFGHIDAAENWARHLLHIRALQERTRGFTEFVPLPFVHMEAPLYLNGPARKGPTFRETLLMHAVARLALHPVLTNIQTSWVKLGREGVRSCLGAGANDLGGTLMNESISRAAGTEHGQELSPEEMESLIQSIGRKPRQRTTLYGEVSAQRHQAGRNAPALLPIAQAQLKALP